MGRRLTALIVCTHPGPTFAVTVFVGLLALSLGSPSIGLLAVVVIAVLSGQMIVGWTNDLIDLPRDTAVRRLEKPLVRGDVSVRAVRICVMVGAVVCIVFSLLCGPVPGLIHLTLGDGMALAYNLVLKSTLMSWLPYTVAFGAAPVVVSLTVADAMPPTSTIAVGALLGFGAHLVNVLPDIADDDATGVHGLAHRLPGRAVAPLAAAALVSASVIGLIGSGILTGGGAPAAAGAMSLAVVFALAGVTVTTSGRTPMYSAIAIAAVDVVVLLIAS